MEEEELRVISGLKERVIEQYEELRTENEKTKDEFDKVKQERDEAVRKLEEFSKISHMVIEEVGFIQNNLEIEKSCRESAEALASKLNKENKNLKRISMLYMAKLGPEVITEEISLDDEDTPSDSDSGEVCTSLDCQQKVKGLHEQVLSAQEEKKAVSLELEELRSRLVDLIQEVNATKKENVMLTKEVFDQRKLLEKYNRVSVLAVEEYEDLQNSLEMEKDLRERAETLAREMIIEQNKLKRQSCLLLQECAPSEQMLNALEENARLTGLLEESRTQHQQKVKELEDQLAEDRLRKEIQSLKKQLEIMEEEKKDLEVKLFSSESLVKDLKHSVQELQKRVHQAENPAPPPPPPPPPLPPPLPVNPIRSLMSIIRKKPSQASSAAKKEIASQSESGNVDDLKRLAVDEMMNRIKRGVHLRPVQQTVRIKSQQPEVKPQSSAVQELRGMLNTISSSTSQRRHGTISTASTETELERILRRRKVTTDQDASTGPLTSTESKSMPVLGCLTNSPLRQKGRNAESEMQCGHPTSQIQGANKPIHIKQTSQSAEALRSSIEKADTTGSTSGIALRAAQNGDTGPINGEKLANPRGKDEDSSNC
ncbi:shootin-1 isoform X2 [Rana temporaria]|uniref:shootin-1 isoform X2 n=1 Tax=Rana temporaria TaxID=8407 RepID=UPI001AAC80E8|nr:shootin-1 isoform X2 [Rana temporaria]